MTLTKKTWISVLALCVLLVLAAGGSGLWLTRDRPALNLDGAGLALSGYDPVSYFEEGGPHPGLRALELEHEGRRYRFANAASRDRFVSDPARYEPAFGGWCAYAVANGYKYEVDPEAFLVEEGRLLLFYRGVLGDAREAFRSEGVEDGLRRADANWPRVRAE